MSEAVVVAIAGLAVSAIGVMVVARVLKAYRRRRRTSGMKARDD